jgi:hypothetical protein
MVSPSTTAAPSARNLDAIAAPIPPLAPAMSATLPSKLLTFGTVQASQPYGCTSYGFGSDIKDSGKAHEPMERPSERNNFDINASVRQGGPVSERVVSERIVFSSNDQDRSKSPGLGPYRRNIGICYISPT